MKLRNDELTPVSEIQKQMLEMRPLPYTGRAEFEEWSDRIISGACLPDTISIRSQKGALANALTHIGPTESHKPDAYFIHALRVNCIKQIAVDVLVDLKAQKDKEDAEKKSAEGQTPA